MKSFAVFVFFLLSVVVLSAASNEIAISKNTIVALSDGKQLQIQFNPSAYRNRSTMCVRNGLTIQEPNFHVEYVGLDQACEWTGLPSGLYEYFFKTRMKGVELVKRYKGTGFAVAKYQKGSGVFYYLSAYDVFGNIFILDYDGSLVSQVCAECDKIAPSERVVTDFDESLIDYNVIGDYFHREMGGGLFPGF